MLKYRSFAKYFLILLLLSLIHTACSTPALNPNEVLAKFGDEVITLEDFNKELNLQAASLPPAFQEEISKSLTAKKRLLEDLIARSLMVKQALQEGIEVSESELERELQRFKSQYTEASFLKTLSTAKISVAEWKERKRQKLILKKFLEVKSPIEEILNPEVIEKYYKTHLKEFKIPQTVRVRQIVTDTKEKAESILRRLRRGENFAKLAQDLSLSPDRSKGGDLGYIAKGSFPREFEVCFTMNPGEISPIIPSIYGFHLFKVVEQVPPRIKALNEVEEQIITQLMIATREKTRKKILEALKNKIIILIYEPLLERIP